jgi:WD40 repeat protein
MFVSLTLWWWIFLYLPGIIVQSLEAQLDVRLVDTLVYNESGSIRSLSWRQLNTTSYQLVAASLSQTQVWNHVNDDGTNRSQLWELERLLDFFVVEPLYKSNETAVKAVSFSPDGNWLAIGKKLNA